MSTEIVDGYTYTSNPSADSLAGNVTATFGYTYLPDQNYPPIFYTYLANPVQLEAFLSSQSAISATLSDSALPAALLRRCITEILSPSTETAVALHRVSVETLSPHVGNSAQLHRMVAEVLSPFAEIATKRRPVTFLILD